MAVQTATRVVAERVREVRKRRGWTMAQLAERCAAIGAPQITENALENLEYGRRGTRRAVTVDDLFALAVALDIAPVHLLVTPDEDETSARRRAWVRGLDALDGDPRLYFSQVPHAEFRQP